MPNGKYIVEVRYKHAFSHNERTCSCNYLSDKFAVRSIFVTVVHPQVFPKCFLVKHPGVNFSRHTTLWVARTSVVAREKAIQGYSAVKDNLAHINYLLSKLIFSVG